MKKLLTFLFLTQCVALFGGDVFYKASGYYRESVNSSDFTDTNLYVLNPTFSPDKATVLAVPAMFRKHDGTNVREMTVAEKDALDIDATGLREAKFDEVFSKTLALEEALTFTWEAKVFKLNNAYQDKWVNIYTFSKDGLITYPKIISTEDGTTHQLDDHADVTSFVGTGLAVAEAFYAGDDQYFIDIKNATNWSDLQAIVDTR
jgi:hypothetical protein